MKNIENIIYGKIPVITKRIKWQYSEGISIT